MSKQIIYPTINSENKCTFNVWAPGAAHLSVIDLTGNREIALEKTGEKGYWKKEVDSCEPGMRYKYRINGDDSYPDPASLSQPEGVHGPSELVDIDAYKWSDQLWKGISPSEMIMYELHTGTFSSEGSFKGISERLDHLLELGINTIEIMPVAQFSGSRNWGYDGVYPFAVHNTYGGAKALMKLVNECHGKGIAVILDVVYNHLGPEGNYVSNFGPYFSGKYSTPLGSPLNFDGPHSDEVRNYFIQNALMWCRDFHIDGLRLDAIHAIYDFSAKHILLELAENLNLLASETGKQYHLIAESDLNDTKIITPPSKGGYGIHGQWSDDFHHALHTLITREQMGYYKDYGDIKQLTKAINQTFIYDGIYSQFRKKSYGNSAVDLPGEQFVIYHQNHDQVGNRKYGERLISLSNFEMAKVAAGTMFVTPGIPMLFMGEEYAERNPFLYFVSHLDPKLNKLVREGRSREFKSFYKDGEEAPDPANKKTFEKSMLSWKIGNSKEKQAMFEYYKALIKLRREHPVLKHPDKKNMRVSEFERSVIIERWQGKNFILAIINFGTEGGSAKIPAGLKGKYIKIIDSANEKWGGPGDSAPEIITANDQIAMPESSIIIYSNK
jgi:maltooligosyltrehalose trehalohydrolase